jgi:hypothetical protein
MRATPSQQFATNPASAGKAAASLGVAFLASVHGEVMSMLAIFGFFNGAYAPLMASVVAFVTFFCIARLVNARQGVAFAFAFTPLLVFFALEAAAASL